MLLYAISDNLNPEPTRRIAPTRKEVNVDEYARVLPMISTTPAGGIFAGLAGQF
jgi:hypothetical protein